MPLTRDFCFAKPSRKLRVELRSPGIRSFSSPILAQEGFIQTSFFLIIIDLTCWTIRRNVVIENEVFKLYYIPSVTVFVLVRLTKKRIMKTVKLSLWLFCITLVLLACSSNEATTSEISTEIKYVNPIEITMNGYDDHMMEPFISPDGLTLFFNNSNSNGNTRLFYATKLNNTSFDFKGEVKGANEDNQNQLNAVADIDAEHNFYWTSIRDYPNKLDNLHFGSYANGTVNNVGRVQGDFYVGQAGWLVMDHGISEDGQTLYYNNAHFNGCGSIPCETFIGIANKVSNGIFQKIVDSDTILATINDSDYIYYAPSITQDNLEFYYTRFKTGDVTPSTLVEICVAKRANASDAFGKPKVLFDATISDGIIEAPTLTSDKQLMYYHKKINGVHKILMRERE